MRSLSGNYNVLTSCSDSKQRCGLIHLNRYVRQRIQSVCQPSRFIRACLEIVSLAIVDAERDTQKRTWAKFISYAVYLGILAFYFVFIYMVFPETKGLTAEAASQVFDSGRHRSQRATEPTATTTPERDSLEADDKYEGVMAERMSKV